MSGIPPQLLAVSAGHERLEQSRQRLWGDRACSRIQRATTSPTRRPGFDRSVFGRSALPVLALPLRVRRPCQDIPSSRNQAARCTSASRDGRNETGPLGSHRHLGDSLPALPVRIEPRAKRTRQRRFWPVAASIFERFVVETEVPLARTRDAFRCREKPSSGCTRIVLAH